MTERVLVTGAGGFVGRHIVTALLSRGWHVVALDMAFDTALMQDWAHQPELELMVGEAGDLPSLKLDALVHAAAVTRTPSDDENYAPELNLKDNLDPVLKLFAWAHQQGLRRSLFISSDAVYSTSQPGAIDESQPPLPYGTYAVAKAATEQMVSTLRGLYRRDVAVVRLSGVYGSGEQARTLRPRVSPILHMIQSATQDGVMQVKRHSPARAWTYAADIGVAIEALLSAQTLKHALYNVATEECLTDAQAAEAIQRHLPHVRIEYDETLHESRRQGYLSHARLRDETGFTGWTPFKTGIEQVLAWYRQQSEISA